MGSTLISNTFFSNNLGVISNPLIEPVSNDYGNGRWRNIETGVDYSDASTIPTDTSGVYVAVFETEFGGDYVPIGGELSVGTLTLSDTDYTYDGMVKTPSTSVAFAGVTLEEGTDYTVIYDDGRIDAGTYQVTITGEGDYTGSLSASFTISAADADDSADTSGTDAGDSESTDSGSMDIRSDGSSGSGSGSGQTTDSSSGLKAQKITVKKAALKKTIHTKKLKKKNQTFKLKASTSGNGKITYKKIKGNKKIKVSKAGKVTVKKGLKKGKTYKVKVKVTAAKTSTYEKATKTVTLKIKIK